MTKKKKRKLSNAARQKRKLMLTGGLAVVLVLVIILAVFVFGGGSTYETDTNTIYLLEDGKVVSNSVEVFDENIYSEKDLESYIKEIVDTYNAENENAVKQKSLTVKDGTATLVMEYADAEDYENFEGTEIFTGTLAEAVKAGYTFEGDFADVTGEKVKPLVSEEFLNNSEYKVLIIKANVTVSFEQMKNTEICIVSAENTASVEDGVVVIKDGANMLANVDLEGTEDGTEAGTEIEGAISEDELLTGDTGPVFDFGDEEEVVNPYSSVYTYIIYK